MAMRGGRILLILGVPVLFLICARVHAAEPEAKVFAGFTEIIKEKAVSPQNPAKDISVLGRVVEHSPGDPFFAGADGGQIVGGALTSSMDAATKQKLSEEVRKAGGSLAVVAKGTLSMTAGQPIPPGPRMTHVFRGPFYNFAMAGFEVLSPKDAAVAAKAVTDKSAADRFVRQVTPIELGKVKVFIELIQVNPPNPLDKRFPAGVVVGLRAWNDSGKPFVLAAPDVAIERGEKKLTCAVASPGAGYQSGPLTVPVRKPTGIIPSGVWFFKVTEGEISGGDEVTVEVMLKDGGKVVSTHREAAKVIVYSGGGTGDR